MDFVPSFRLTGRCCGLPIALEQKDRDVPRLEAAQHPCNLWPRVA